MFGMCVCVENWQPTAPVLKAGHLHVYVCASVYTCIICVCTELVDTGLVVCRKGMGEDIPPLGTYIFEKSVLSVSHLLLATLM